MRRVIFIISFVLVFMFACNLYANYDFVSVSRRVLVYCNMKHNPQQRVACILSVFYFCNLYLSVGLHYIVKHNTVSYSFGYMFGYRSQLQSIRVINVVNMWSFFIRKNLRLLNRRRYNYLYRFYYMNVFIFKKMRFGSLHWWRSNAYDILIKRSIRLFRVMMIRIPGSYKLFLRILWRIFSRDNIYLSKYKIIYWYIYGRELGCGHLRARIPKGISQQEWKKYKCMSKKEAQEQWKKCLRQHQYIRGRLRGCPGSLLCCPNK